MRTLDYIVIASARAPVSCVWLFEDLQLRLSFATLVLLTQGVRARGCAQRSTLSPLTAKEKRRGNTVERTTQTVNSTAERKKRNANRRIAEQPAPSRVANTAC